MKINFQGKTYKNHKELAEAFNVKVCTLESRISRYKMTLEQALAVPRYTATPTIDHEGRRFESVTALTNYYGIKKSTFFYRLSRGYTPYECIFGKEKKCQKE